MDYKSDNGSSADIGARKDSFLGRLKRQAALTLNVSCGSLKRTNSKRKSGSRETPGPTPDQPVPYDTNQGYEVQNSGHETTVGLHSRAYDRAEIGNDVMSQYKNHNLRAHGVINGCRADDIQARDRQHQSYDHQNMDFQSNRHLGQNNNSKDQTSVYENRRIRPDSFSEKNVFHNQQQQTNQIDQMKNNFFNDTGFDDRDQQSITPFLRTRSLTERFSNKPSSRVESRPLTSAGSLRVLNSTVKVLPTTDKAIDKAFCCRCQAEMANSSQPEAEIHHSQHNLRRSVSEQTPAHKSAAIDLFSDSNGLDFDPNYENGEGNGFPGFTSNQKSLGRENLSTKHTKDTKTKYYTSDAGNIQNKLLQNGRNYANRDNYLTGNSFNYGFQNTTSSEHLNTPNRDNPSTRHKGCSKISPSIKQDNQILNRTNSYDTERDFEIYDNVKSVKSNSRKHPFSLRKPESLTQSMVKKLEIKEGSPSQDYIIQSMGIFGESDQNNIAKVTKHSVKSENIRVQLKDDSPKLSTFGNYNSNKLLVTDSKLEKSSKPSQSNHSNDISKTANNKPPIYQNKNNFRNDSNTSPSESKSKNSSTNSSLSSPPTASSLKPCKKILSRSNSFGEGKKKNRVQFDPNGITYHEVDRATPCEAENFYPQKSSKESNIHKHRIADTVDSDNMKPSNEISSTDTDENIVHHSNHDMTCRKEQEQQNGMTKPEPTWMGDGSSVHARLILTYPMIGLAKVIENPHRRNICSPISHATTASTHYYNSIKNHLPDIVGSSQIAATPPHYEQIPVPNHQLATEAQNQHIAKPQDNISYSNHQRNRSLENRYMTQTVNNNTKSNNHVISSIQNHIKKLNQPPFQLNSRSFSHDQGYASFTNASDSAISAENLNGSNESYIFKARQAEEQNQPLRSRSAIFYTPHNPTTQPKPQPRFLLGDNLLHDDAMNRSAENVTFRKSDILRTTSQINNNTNELDLPHVQKHRLADRKYRQINNRTWYDDLQGYDTDFN